MATDKMNSIPIGTIMLWTKTSSILYGIPNCVPDGWEICDGSEIKDSNGNSIILPDMRHRFIKGAPSGNTMKEIIEKTSESNKLTNNKIYLLTNNIPPEIVNRFIITPSKTFNFNPKDKGNGWANYGEGTGGDTGSESGGHDEAPNTVTADKASVFIKYGVSDDHSMPSEKGAGANNRHYLVTDNGTIALDNFCNALEIKWKPNSYNKLEPIDVEPLSYTAVYIIKIK